MEEISFYDFLDKRTHVETTNTPLNMIVLFSNDFDGYFRSGLMTGDVSKNLILGKNLGFFLKANGTFFFRDNIYVMVMFNQEEDEIKKLLRAFDLIYTYLISKGFGGQIGFCKRSC